MEIGSLPSIELFQSMQAKRTQLPYQASTRIQKDIQRTPLFHDLTLNNGYSSYFRFDDDNETKYINIFYQSSQGNG